jgi:hypothetical protein
MSCELDGHFGAEDGPRQPKYRCVYCGSWGYLPRWRTEDLDEFLTCECDHDFDGHILLCD